MIQVIDAPCGAGKTSWAVQHINEHDEDNFVFCTPFLEEIDRIRSCCGNYHRFAEPLPYEGSKLDDFNNLLSSVKDIAVTHVTFLNATSETIELVRSGSYTLIIDEALDVVMNFNNVQSVAGVERQSITRGDIKFLTERNIIHIQENQRVVWNGGENENEYKFSEVERFAKLNRLYCVGDEFLVTIFPPEIFDAFENVFVLTYLFDSCTLKYYFDMFNIPYVLKTIVKNDNVYTLEDWSVRLNNEFRARCKDLIKICSDKKLNDYKRGMLTKSWYDNAKEDDLKTMKNNLYTFFKRRCKAKANNEEIMWTCFNDYKNKLSGPGFTASRQLKAEEKELPQREKQKIEQELSCFVSCNAKATNKYQMRWALAYCIDVRYHPMIRRFFTHSNDERISQGLSPIRLNEEAYALSCLIQWVFRSRIRTGQDIRLYIPSRRMRELLCSWLNGTAGITA